MEHFSIYCAGEFIDTTERLEVRNPHDQSLLGLTSLAGQEQLEKAIEAAHQSARSLRRLSSGDRSAILSQIADALEEAGDYPARLLAAEAAKPLRYARGEVARAVQTFRVAAEETKRWPQDILELDWTPAGRGKRGFVRMFPIGPIAGIAPFNFPLNLAVHKIAPALAAACPIVLKPATSTPLSTLALARIIAGTELPAGAVSIMPMDRSTGSALVTDERFKMLSFTGSPEVGWGMKARAGKKKVILELGGNAGVIVTASADLDAAVNRCLAGAFAYSGQVCIHTQRIYVAREVFDPFRERMTAAVAGLKEGSPLDEETEISSMIDEANAIRVQAWVEEARQQGAHVLCGGGRRGSMMEATILTGTRPSMRVCSEEVFGPVITLEPFDELGMAIEEVNQGRFGLQAGIFTDSIAEMELAWDRIEAGGVIVNDVPTFRVDHMPYGGVKDSGLGREGVRYAMLEMLEPRLLVR